VGRCSCWGPPRSARRSTTNVSNWRVLLTATTAGFLRTPPVPRPTPERVLRVELAGSPSRRRMSGNCAFETFKRRLESTFSGHSKSPVDVEDSCRPLPSMVAAQRQGSPEADVYRAHAVAQRWTRGWLWGTFHQAATPKPARASVTTKGSAKWRSLGAEVTLASGPIPPSRLPQSDRYRAARACPDTMPLWFAAAVLPFGLLVVAFLSERLAGSGSPRRGESLPGDKRRVLGPGSATSRADVAKDVWDRLRTPH
jgi:hypothetical protein